MNAPSILSDKEEKKTMTENETTHARVQQEITFRDASIHDVEAIAALHAESWRRHYRGAYLDSFLDGDVLANRLEVWHTRMTVPSADHFTIGAFRSDAVVGFVHVFFFACRHTFTAASLRQRESVAPVWLI